MSCQHVFEGRLLCVLRVLLEVPAGGQGHPPLREFHHHLTLSLADKMASECILSRAFHSVRGVLVLSHIYPRGSPCLRVLEPGSRLFRLSQKLWQSWLRFSR